MAARERRTREEKRDTTSKKPTTLVPEDHPQRLYLIDNAGGRPAISLEAWFDAGLTKPKADEEEDSGSEEEVPITHLVGLMPLPKGYAGVNKDQILAVARDSQVQVWPVRFDVGEIASDVEKPWTLYHYCSKDSFDECVRTMLEVQSKLEHMSDTEVQQEITKLMLAHLANDYEDRLHGGKATQHNPRSDPELLLVEPGRFNSHEEVMQALFGSAVLTRRTRKGIALEIMGDYCIGFRVPGSACFPVPGGKDQGMGTVRVCRETLELLKKRGEQRREAASKDAHIRKIQDADKKNKKKKKGGCFGCFGAQADMDDEDTPALKGRKHLQAHHGEDCIVRTKRELDQVKLLAMNAWARDHFVGVQTKVEHSHKVQQEEAAAIAAKKERQRAKKERETEKKEYPKNAVVLNRVLDEEDRARLAKERAKEAAKPSTLNSMVQAILRPFGGEKRLQAMSSLSSRKKEREISQVLYEEFRRVQDEENKDIQKPALVRIKLGKSGAELYQKRRKSIASQDSAVGGI